MITTFFAFIFVLGVLVFVHELGHFLTAKKIGIRVIRFSLGFPPKLISKKIGETEYCVSWIPLGGYVKMAGENPDEKELTGAPWEFQSRKVWERLIVVIAGPAMNFLTAILIFWGIFSISGLPTIRTTKIGVIEEGSLAATVGCQVGDSILTIGGSSVEEWNDIYDALEAHPEGNLIIEIDRRGVVHRFTIPGDERDDDSDFPLGITPLLGTEVGSVIKNKPAYKSGLRTGDRILSIDGEPIDLWDDMKNLIHAKPDIPITVTWTRVNQIFEAEIVPEKQQTMNIDGEVEDIGLIGIGPKVDRKRIGIHTSLWLGLRQTIYMAELTIIFVKKLVLRQVSAKLVGGPVSIARMAGETARSGLMDLFGLMALLSVNLAILNVLPIPILDGGHVLFLLIEGVTRKPLSLKKRGILQQIGLAFLILLMIYVTYNDIAKLFQ
jgi:regulator of sigma E protease